MPSKKDNSKFKNLKDIFEKSLAVNKNLKKGDVLTFDDLEGKKPKGFGINANEFEKYLGKKINRDLIKWDFINKEDF